MGLFKDYVSQTRKPEGFLGKMMLRGMNSGHAKMADWGFPSEREGAGGGYHEAAFCRRRVTFRLQSVKKILKNY